MAQPRNNVGYGLTNALQLLAPLVVVAPRAPTTNDIGYELGTRLVLNIDEPFDDFYGEGPYNMAFAYRKKGEWLNFNHEKISSYDFRDWANHNVGGHSGKISHALNAYSISCIVLNLLDENEKLKRLLKGYGYKKDKNENK